MSMLAIRTAHVWRHSLLRACPQALKERETSVGTPSVRLEAALILLDLSLTLLLECIHEARVLRSARIQRGFEVGTIRLPSERFGVDAFLVRVYLMRAVQRDLLKRRLHGLPRPTAQTDRDARVPSLC